MGVLITIHLKNGGRLAVVRFRTCGDVRFRSLKLDTASTARAYREASAWAVAREPDQTVLVRGWLWADAENGHDG